MSLNVRRLDRRELARVAGLTGAGLLAGCGQWPWPTAPAPSPTIGFLTPGTPAGGAPTPGLGVYGEAFRDGLGELGYVEGQNIAVERRRSDHLGLAAPASELVHLPLKALVTVGITATRAARGATSTIPIVQAVGADLVDAGLAASLARPGGNVTGLTTITVELAGKRLEIPHEALGRAPRIAVVWNGNNPDKARELRATEIAAESLGVQVQSLPVQAEDEFGSAFDRAIRGRADGLLVFGDGVVGPTRVHSIAALALQWQLLAMCPMSEFVEAGGPMAYGLSFLAMVRRATTYVDKMLKGAKPEALPIKRPMRFFAINLRTAEALGLTIPPHVLLQATELVQ